jgi:hypothetical protein
MEYTYDLNTNGCLIITCNPEESAMIQELANTEGEYTATAECDALESLLANSELDWIAPEEIGALTGAPILGFRDESGEPTAAWGFMDYALRSFLTDLAENGKAVFTS